MARGRAMNKEFPVPDNRLSSKVKLVQVLPFERDVLRLASSDAPETTLEQGKAPLGSRRIQFTQFSKFDFHRVAATLSKASSRTSASLWCGGLRSAASPSSYSTWWRTSPPIG